MFFAYIIRISHTAVTTFEATCLVFERYVDVITMKRELQPLVGFKCTLQLPELAIHTASAAPKSFKWCMFFSLPNICLSKYRDEKMHFFHFKKSFWNWNGRE